MSSKYLVYPKFHHASGYALFYQEFAAKIIRRFFPFGKSSLTFKGLPREMGLALKLNLLEGIYKI